MRVDIKEIITYFRHLFELVNMSRDWDAPHRIAIDLYKARINEKREIEKLTLRSNG